jgi:hypothetical protein
VQQERRMGDLRRRRFIQGQLWRVRGRNYDNDDENNNIIDSEVSNTSVKG